MARIHCTEVYWVFFGNVTEIDVNSLIQLADSLYCVVSPIHLVPSQSDRIMRGDQAHSTGAMWRCIEEAVYLPLLTINISVIPPEADPDRYVPVNLMGESACTIIWCIDVQAEGVYSTSGVITDIRVNNLFLHIIGKRILDAVLFGLVSWRFSAFLPGILKNCKIPTLQYVLEFENRRIRKTPRTSK